jgi:hypothetical protein
MPALSIHEASKHSTGVVKREAIIRSFLDNSAILRYLPFLDIRGDTYTYNLEDQLPGVGWRGYNEGFETHVGVINPQTEVLKIIGSDVDVDRRIVWTRGEAVRAEQEQSTIRSLSMQINDTMINGDSSTNPRQFDGLRRRITGNQLIPANLSTPNANAPLSMAALLKAIDEVMNPSAILMSPAMKRRLDVAAQQNMGGEIRVGKDDFGFRTSYLNGLPILPVGYDNTGKWIMDFNESGPAGGSQSSSIYIVSFDNEGVRGLQNGGIMVDDLGELDAKPVYRTRIEWQLGLTVHRGRAASRIWGITDAPVTQ